MVADGAFVVEVGIREHIVDDGHTGGAGAVACGELAARHQRNPQRLKVAGADRVETRAHVLVIFGLVAFTGDAISVVIAGDDTHHGDRRRLHTRRGGNPSLYFLGEAADALRLVARERWIHGEAKQMVAAESQVDALQIVQRSREQLMVCISMMRRPW